MFHKRKILQKNRTCLVGCLIGLCSKTCSMTFQFPPKKTESIQIPRLKYIGFDGEECIDIDFIFRNRIDNRLNISKQSNMSVYRSRISCLCKKEVLHFLEDYLSLKENYRLENVDEYYDGVDGTLKLIMKNGILYYSDIMEIGRAILEKINSFACDDRRIKKFEVKEIFNYYNWNFD